LPAIWHARNINRNDKEYQRSGIDARVKAYL